MPIKRTRNLPLGWSWSSSKEWCPRSGLGKCLSRWLLEEALTYQDDTFSVPVWLSSVSFLLAWVIGSAHTRDLSLAHTTRTGATLHALQARTYCQAVEDKLWNSRSLFWSSRGICLYGPRPPHCQGFAATGCCWEVKASAPLSSKTPTIADILILYRKAPGTSCYTLLTKVNCLQELPNSSAFMVEPVTFMIAMSRSLLHGYWIT